MKSGGTNGRRTARIRDRRGWIELGIAAGKVVGLAAGLGAVGVGGYHLYEIATTSPFFAVERIELLGAERADAESLVHLAGVRIGDNTLGLDLEEIQRTVEAHPWVRSARVSRDLISGLRIEVAEHVPVVLVALGHLYYADAAGQIVKRYAPGEGERLPVVTGLTRKQLETDDGQSRVRLQRAIRFLDEIESLLGKEAPRVSELHVDEVRGLSFVEEGGATTVMVGDPPFAEKIHRLREVRASLVSRGVSSSQIMLDGRRRPDRAVATLLPPGEEAR